MSPGRPLRTLHLVGDPPGGSWAGRQSQAMLLAGGLAAKGHRPELAATAGSLLAARAAREGLPLRELPAGWARRILALRRVLASQAWDVIHLHDPGSLRQVGWAGPGRRAGGASPWVLSVTGDVAYGDRAIRTSGSLRRVTQFWAASEWVWSALVRAGLPEERIAVVHTAVDLKRFTMSPDEAADAGRSARRDLGLAADDFVVGTAQRLAGQEGVDRLLEACRMIRMGEAPPGEERIRLLVVGEGPRLEALRKLAARAGVGDLTRFTGWREDLPRLMAAMDVYVHPSLSGDGFPVSLREAMAMARPVVATDLMGIREIIDNGKHGLIVPAADAASLARAILRYRRDPDLSQQAGRIASLKVQRYGERAMVDRAEELYFRLVR